MRVSHNNQYAYQQQRTSGNGKDTGFADMFASMAADKSRGERAEKHGGCQSNHMGIETLNMRLANPHRFHGTQIRPTAEQLAMVEEYDSGITLGRLYLAQEENTAELRVSEPFVPDLPEPKYPASIHDLSDADLEEALQAARLACHYLNTDGMTKVEIYNSMESIFKDYLGKDFKEPMLIYGGVENGGPQGSRVYNLHMTEMFLGLEMRAKGVNIHEDPEILKEARGYTGMSETEMRAAVRANYPENMTVKDCILMANELWELDLEDINYGYHIKSHISMTLGIDPQEYSKMEGLYNSVLNMPADFDAIKASQEAFEKGGCIIRPTNSIENAFSSLISWLGSGESAGSDILDQLLAMLCEMEKEGIIGFDEFGHLQSIEQNFKQ